MSEQYFNLNSSTAIVEWMKSMDVAGRCGYQEVGVASGWNL